MDDALLVRRLERFRDLLRDRDRFVDGNRSALQALGEVLALDQLEHEEAAAVRDSFEAVDRADVGMVEGGEELRLPLEAREALGIARHLGGQHLDRHLAVELGVACARYTSPIPPAPSREVMR